MLESASSQSDELVSVLSDAILNRRFVPVKRYSHKNAEYTIDIPLTGEFINEKNVNLIAIQKKYPNITVVGNRLSIIIKDGDDKMMRMVDQYEQYFRSETIVKEDTLKLPLSPNTKQHGIQTSH